MRPATTASSVDLDRLVRLRVIVARVGEMDLAQWWNTKGQLGPLGAQKAQEGERLASVQINAYFTGGVETEEQLDSALSGLREECVRLIGAGKKVVLS